MRAGNFGAGREAPRAVQRSRSLLRETERSPLKVGSLSLHLEAALPRAGSVTQISATAQRSIQTLIELVTNFNFRRRGKTPRLESGCYCPSFALRDGTLNCLGQRWMNVHGVADRAQRSSGVHHVDEQMDELRALRREHRRSEDPF